MRTYRFVTLDVFTDRRLGGNPLAVIPDARGLNSAEMQAIAREFNLSETTFVLPPADPANTAQVRIFTPALEMSFAGHPNVGTGYVLAQAGRDQDGLLRFEELAGLVTVRVERDAGGNVSGATIDAPQPLTLGASVAADDVAACASLALPDLVLGAHAPCVASMGTAFVFAQVTPAALARAQPNVTAFQAAQARHPQLNGRFHLHLYARDAASVRTRMFAPLGGVFEDPATGSANVTLAALLLSLGDAQDAWQDITQGVEMGRPSLLHTRAWRTADGIRASVGGRCVPVMQGELTID
ncbi:MAG: PhzF family phenazine biosynthesis protein [Burkholderiales bacterium]|jgi:trans-2,3-dihydro-3-hydroxyanthranilate isomerase|nr:PhzF family phenazine biosynthesis protein [Burkholderiales bacterium]